MSTPKTTATVPTAHESLAAIVMEYARDLTGHALPVELADPKGSTRPPEVIPSVRVKVTEAKREHGNLTGKVLLVGYGEDADRYFQQDRPYGALSAHWPSSPASIDGIRQQARMPSGTIYALRNPGGKDVHGTMPGGVTIRGARWQIDSAAETVPVATERYGDGSRNLPRAVRGTVKVTTDGARQRATFEARLPNDLEQAQLEHLVQRSVDYHDRDASTYAPTQVHGIITSAELVSGVRDEPRARYTIESLLDQ